MSDSKTPSVGFSGFLALIFITLKLTGFINWSWWWVLSPLWISLGLFLAALAVAFVVTLIVLFFKKK